MSGEIKTTEPLKHMNKFKRKWIQMTVKQKRRSVMKIILFIVCGSLLVYHSYQLFDQYNSGQTLVTIKYTRFKRESVPAFTVCVPLALRMDGLADRFPDLRDNYTRYRQLIDSVGDSDYDNETLKDSLNLMYKQFVDYYIDQRLPLMDIYNDSSLTVPHLLTTTNSNDTNQTQIDGQYIHALINVYNNRNLIQLKDFRPIVSLMNLDYPAKCLTYFSELNRNYRQFKTNLESITVTINHNKHWFPTSMYDKKLVTFIMHSANNTPYDLPNENIFTLSMNNGYWIGYSTIKTRRLPPTWDTMCREYDIYDYSGGGGDTISGSQSRTRSDCRYRCFWQHLQQKNRCCISHNNHTVVDCNGCIPWDTSLIPDYMVGAGAGDGAADGDTNLTQCYNYIDYGSCELPFKDSCDEQCPDQCYEKHYIMTLISKHRIQFLRKQYNTNRWDNSTLSAYIRHSAHLDHLVEHSPEMTRIEFLSNLGGLLGMWLGLAVFTILDLIVKLI